VILHGGLLKKEEAQNQYLLISLLNRCYFEPGFRLFILIVLKV